jgi:hypothetical protein
VDGECELAIAMLPSQAKMRRAQFAFANGRMPTFRVRLKLPGFPTIFLEFVWHFFVFFYIFLFSLLAKFAPSFFHKRGRCQKTFDFSLDSS